MRPLLTESDIQRGVCQLAQRISGDYQGRPLTLIGVLTGSIVLVADLIRLLDMPLRVGVVQARSYRGAATAPGALAINDEMLPDIRGRDVLVVDDIFDTGNTLLELIELLDDLGPRSIRSAVLLRKADRQQVNMQPDYVAFEIPNEFVVGYGLDYHDHYRNLPYVAVLEPAELDDGAKV